jgi:hypothetical protein
LGGSRTHACMPLCPALDACAGILVPASFTVGDCIDFISRLAKLERYKACRSLERIFVTGGRQCWGCMCLCL